MRDIFTVLIKIINEVIYYFKIIKKKFISFTYKVKNVYSIIS